MYVCTYVQQLQYRVVVDIDLATKLVAFSLQRQQLRALQRTDTSIDYGQRETFSRPDLEVGGSSHSEVAFRLTLVCWYSDGVEQRPR